MSYGRGKKDNEYSRLVFDVDAPKTVWMALAVSFANRIAGGSYDGVDATCFSEWQALYDNRIVPQKPMRVRK